MTRQGDKRWVTVGRRNWLTRLVVVSPIALVLVLSNGTQFAVVFTRAVPLPWSVILVVAVAAALFGLTTLIVQLVYPPVQVNAAEGRMRAGRRSAAYSELVTARLLVSASRSKRTLHLLLHTTTGLRAVIPVRDAGGRTLDEAEASIVAEAIRRSSIAMPVSRDDPKGRFARFNFPDNVTKDEALGLIEHPPVFDDPLPIPPRV